MVCENMREKCHLYLDGRLDEQQQKELEDHLKTCPECREYLAQMHEVKELLHKTRVNTSSQVDWDVVQKKAAMRTRQQRTSRMRKIVYGATAAAAVMLCLFLAPLLQDQFMSHATNEAVTAESAEMAAPEDKAMDAAEPRDGEAGTPDGEIPSSTSSEAGGLLQESTPEESTSNDIAQNGKQENPALEIYDAAQTYVESGDALFSGELTLEDIEAYLPQGCAGQAVIEVKSGQVTYVEYTDPQGEVWTYQP